MDRFRDFFHELREGFVEREDVLMQFALALLSRQHVLVTGPPGTAKSQMATQVLSRIIDEETGESSVFARQLTESTVQTDLVGPIDFKTLIGTGRTQHFTDEGLLGSVHAFLDEVFDGRDMLLRSTLNLLHERELKQGGVTTRGRIECAFMTSNRYIAEILDTSRETLLAFVDRISFIGFVPRGFADPTSLEQVVRRHGAGIGRRGFTAPLTIQDLDLLQASVETVHVSDEICAAVAQLVRELDIELAEACRMDPRFQPTRYLSTRTAVQAITVLRAVALFDRIFRDRGRDRQVRFEDLAGLRYNLLLSGPGPGAAKQLMEHETNPRERRQLDIMRTEAEIFARCLARVPVVELAPRKPALPPRSSVELSQPGRGGDPVALAGAVRMLVEAAESGAPDADEAARLLVTTVGRLADQAWRGGLTTALPASGSLPALSEDLVAIAENLEHSGVEGRPVARWLRGRLVQALDRATLLAPVTSQESLEVLLTHRSRDAIDAQVEARLEALESTHALRTELLSTGAWLGEPGGSAQPWRAALARLEDELTLLCDARLHTVASELLQRAKQQPLDEVLGELEPFVTGLEAVAARFEAMGGQSQLKQRVLGPRMEPLVEHALARLDGSDRVEVVDTVRRVVEELENARLGAIVAPAGFVAWTVAPLVRDAVASDVAEPFERRDDYLRLTAGWPAISVTEALQQIAILTLAPEMRQIEDPSSTAADIADVLRGLDARARDAVIAADLARIEGGVAILEGWWARLTSADEEPLTKLERVVGSGYLRVVRDDAAPLRLAMEAERLAEVFPSCEADAATLRGRVQRLDAESTEVLVGLLSKRSDAEWRDTLETSS
ncbi:MAG: AAA family ATPase [Sandaracinaceae bacterium]|nr:AAA family ATPase [Sandaracinaceae bacterium]